MIEYKFGKKETDKALLISYKAPYSIISNNQYHPRADFLADEEMPCNTPSAFSKAKLFEENLKVLKENLRLAQDDAKRFANLKRRDHDYKVGDLVWLSKKNLGIKERSRKLSSKAVGPFKIIEEINSVAFKLELPEHFRIHPVFHVSLFKPYHENQIPGRIQPGPDPEIVNEEEEFHVEKILAKRTKDGITQFLVKWEGYPDDENTWEPREMLTHCTTLLHEFLKPTKKPNRRGRRFQKEDNVRNDEASS